MPLDRKDMLLITSPYGKREDPINKGQTQIHHGIDLRAQNNSILATENGGKVIDVNHSTNSGGGKSLTIEYSSEDGTKTRVQYMHLSQIDVKVGDAVGAGQKLGVTDPDDACDEHGEKEQGGEDGGYHRCRSE